ncbi:MAG: protein BatD [Bacteroidetes bacterium]|nr:protein BatD [Bacteroidota bacterium]
MVRLQKFWQFFLVGTCVFWSTTTWAQNAVFSANASATKIGLNDQLQVDYRIENVSNLRSISKPDFKDFIVVGGPFSSQSSNISIVGNKMVQSQSYTHSYVLQPKKTGTLGIPPAIAKDANGATYESNALSVQVVSGSIATRQQQSTDPFDDPFNDPFAAMMQQRRQALQAMQQQRQRQQPHQAQEAQAPITDMKDVYKNLFIRVSVDKTKAYVGEQITASYKLYARMPMNVAISKLPSLNGFWTQDFILPGQGALKPEEEVVNGKTYQVFLLKKSALFPQQTGTLTLDPAEAEGQARIITQSQQKSPFGGMFDDDPFFQQFGSLMMSDPFFNSNMFNTVAYKDVPVKLKSEPVKINILPLPDKEKPQNFSNAVGNFTISASVDKPNLSTDDALTLTLRISGTGNLKLIETPKIQLPNGLSTYDPVIVDTITGRTTTISGTKIITYTVSPNVAGDYEIPAIPFSYYNPASSRYASTQTQPIKIHVTKGKHYNPTLAQKDGLSDIHDINHSPLNTSLNSKKPMLLRTGYWSAFAIPTLLFIGLLVWKKRDENLSKDSASLKLKRANKIALRRLKTAKQLLDTQKHTQFYEEVSKAIWLYLSDKLSIPLSELSKERAYEMLTAKEISTVLMTQTQSLMEQCETALYAPGSGKGQMEQAYKSAIDLISKLEETV